MWRVCGVMTMCFDGVRSHNVHENALCAFSGLGKFEYWIGSGEASPRLPAAIVCCASQHT